MSYIVKRIIWIVIICAWIVYLGHIHLQKKSKEKAQSSKEKAQIEETQRINQQIRSKVSQMVTTTNAVDDWLQKLRKGNQFRIGKILTIELEKLWMSERPILFTGSIEDISGFDEQNYNLHLESGIYRSFFTGLLSTNFILRLKCNKIVIDGYLKENQDLLSNHGLTNGVAVIANIDRIETEFIEGEEKRVGIGECIDITYIGSVLF